MPDICFLFLSFAISVLVACALLTACMVGTLGQLICFQAFHAATVYTLSYILWRNHFEAWMVLCGYMSHPCDCTSYKLTVPHFWDEPPNAHSLVTWGILVKSTFVNKTAMTKHGIIRYPWKQYPGSTWKYHQLFTHTHTHTHTHTLTSGLLSLLWGHSWLSHHVIRLIWALQRNVTLGCGFTRHIPWQTHPWLDQFSTRILLQPPRHLVIYKMLSHGEAASSMYRPRVSHPAVPDHNIMWGLWKPWDL